MTVLVAGAGPTGLALACGLLEAGVPTRLVDAAAGPATTSRALGLQSRGVEVLDRLGALGTLPARGIDAPVDPVGVEPQGEMTLPADVDRVGWYRFGPVPGAAEGTAVVAGHVDDAEQGLGALAPLRTAEPGDEVLVEAADGAVTRWTVGSRERIEKPGVPLGDLFARTGSPQLVLITCGGPFDAELRSYRDNVVVVATPRT